MRLPPLCLAALAALAAPAGPAAAQGVGLPHRTGHLRPAADWVVLGAEELAATSRASDPDDPRARALLLGIVNELRQQQRTGEHVLLHQPGERPDQLRIVSAYSTPIAATSAELVDPDHVAAMQELLQKELATTASDVTYRGSGVVLWYGEHPNPMLAFDLVRGDVPCTFRQYLVPAGERLQYFETWHMRDDERGEARCEALLQTFDGAAQPPRSLTPVVLAGMAGGLLGIATAMWRRRRQARRMLARQQAGTT